MHNFIAFFADQVPGGLVLRGAEEPDGFPAFLSLAWPAIELGLCHLIETECDSAPLAVSCGQVAHCLLTSVPALT
jgi:hypothetical protein